MVRQAHHERLLYHLLILEPVEGH